ncbi:alpha-hydroxy acid oxidase [Streptomyces sp. NPDC090085]|uniref:alpha-hydroxy acid oxidase n=1 Tax=Streptomyces sp. NPDC090085 TaxID=3365943 RepID=UPI0037F624A0
MRRLPVAQALSATRSVLIRGVPPRTRRVASIAEARQRFETVEELCRHARRVLPPRSWTFLTSGAGRDEGVRSGEEAFGRIRFVPRVFAAPTTPNLATTFLGIPLAIPVLSAPFGVDGLFHPRGHLDTATGCARAGVASIIPEAGTYSLETVAREAPGAARLFQLHPGAGIEALAERAAAAGYTAVCLTADQPVIGWRDRIREDRFEFDRRYVAGNHTAEATDRLRRIHQAGSPAWSWADLKAFCASSPLPVLVKGVLHPSDAEAAIAAGAAGLIISTHGGRQLHSSVTSLEQLPTIRATVGPDIPLVLDSGVRRGGDIIKALALGADAVALGRLAAVALAAAGAIGVERLIELLAEEAMRTMQLIGASNIGMLTPELLADGEAK